MQAGDRLGPYQVIAKLGEGGMGVVYRALDTRLGRDVAIKLLPDILADDPDRIRRFDREARAVATLNHPNICQIYDVAADPGGEDRPAGPRYLVLEYVDGEPAAGPIPEERAIGLALQISSALEAAHRRGILHRDLKPSNVLITRSGSAKLLDFGVAKILGGQEDSLSDTVPHTGEGMILGSAGYLSPEQAEGQSLDARSDLFSFGTVLYEMLSGRQAFPGRTALQSMAAVLTREPEPLNLSPALADIVRRCLAKDPADRFQSAAELTAALRRAQDGAGEERPSIAVLPFANLSVDPDNEYFGDGLAEEIINALVRSSGLRVIARTSAFAFKGRNEDVRRVAAALGVGHVLEGSVRHAGGRIRVTAQLISAADGGHLWSERYDRELSDIFAVQDDISTAIAQALQVTLSPGSGVQYTPDLAAYEQYLRGLYETQQWTPESIGRARLCFERSIALDPRFGLPHAASGHLYLLLGLYGTMPQREAFPLARVQAARAVEIEPGLPEGHAVLGAVAALYDYDWAGAEAHFARALSVGAVSSRVHHYYGHYYLLPRGRAADALQQQTVALSADPLNLTIRTARAVSLRAAGRLDEANAEFQRMIESDPSFWFPWFTLGVHQVLEGRLEEAARTAEQAHRLAPWFKPVVALQAAVEQLSGREQHAAELAAELQREPVHDPIGPAMFHLLCGDLETAAQWTARAIEQRQPAVFFFLAEHGSQLRASPRWPELARMMNLPT